MKFYDSQFAPNARRVRIFAAEKGIELPSHEVNLMAGETQKPPFSDKNPFGGVPVLELDDGTWLAESVAICLYLELTHPETPLLGTTPKEKAVVEMWNRRLELGLFDPAANAFRHTAPMFKDRMTQSTEAASALQEKANGTLRLLDRVLADSSFVAGADLSIADITAFCVVEFGTAIKVLERRDDEKNIQRWHEQLAARPAFSK